MDYLTLTSTQPVSRPVLQETDKDLLPTLGRPEVFDHGPPGTGAPPPDSKAAGPQKEVSANEQKPQAKILDLLEEILPVDLLALLPQQVRPQLSKHSGTPALGIATGDLKLNAASTNVRDLLGALGVEIPKDTDALDVGQLKKAVAEQIIEYGVPPNIRGLLASLLHAEDAVVSAGKNDTAPTISSGRNPGAVTKLGFLTTAPLTEKISNLGVDSTALKTQPSLDYSVLRLNSEAEPLGVRQIGPPIRFDVPPLNNAAEQLGVRQIGPPISLDTPPLNNAAEQLGVRQIGPPISLDVPRLNNKSGVLGGRQIGPPISQAATSLNSAEQLGIRQIGPPINQAATSLSSDSDVLGVRQIGPPITLTSKVSPDDVRFAKELRPIGDVELSTDRAVMRQGRAGRVPRTRTIGTIELGRTTESARNDFDVAPHQLTRNLDQLEGKIVEALKFKQVVAERAPTTGIDIEQLASRLVKGYALKKAPLTERVITTDVSTKGKPEIVSNFGSPLSDSLSKEVDPSIDVRYLRPAATDLQSEEAPRPRIRANNAATEVAPTTKDGTTIKFADQDSVASEVAKLAPGQAVKVSDADAVVEKLPFAVALNEDTSLEDSLFEEDATTVKHATDVKPTKSATQVASKVDVAMERVTEVQNKIVEQVQEMAAMRGNGRVTIKLHPDDLGTITLAVSTFGGKVDTKITASNESVRHALHIQRTDLVQGIESKGLSLNSFTVGQEAGSEAQAQNQSNAQSQGDTMRQEFERTSNIRSAQSPAPTPAESPSHYVGRSDKAIDYLA